MGEGKMVWCQGCGQHRPAGPDGALLSHRKGCPHMPKAQRKVRHMPTKTATAAPAAKAKAKAVKPAPAHAPGQRAGATYDPTHGCRIDKRRFGDGYVLQDGERDAVIAPIQPTLADAIKYATKLTKAQGGHWWLRGTAKKEALAAGIKHIDTRPVVGGPHKGTAPSANGAAAEKSFAQVTDKTVVTQAKAPKKAKATAAA